MCTCTKKLYNFTDFNCFSRYFRGWGQCYWRGSKYAGKGTWWVSFGRKLHSFASKYVFIFLSTLAHYYSNIKFVDYVSEEDEFITKQVEEEKRQLRDSTVKQKTAAAIEKKAAADKKAATKQATLLSTKKGKQLISCMLNAF